MKILFYGARGWIGQQIIQALDQHLIVLGNARCEHYDQVWQELRLEQPDVVFCCLGRTHGFDEKEQKQYNTIDYLELPQRLQQNVNDNLVAPLNCARACKEHGCKMVYIGTGCIFQYDQLHQIPNDAVFEQNPVGFTEQDNPNFFGSAYSRVKGWTDMEMRRQYDDVVLNLRIRMPISNKRHARNFITKITTYAKICSVPNSMTDLPSIVPIIVHMIETGMTGTYNMCNPGVIEHNRILDMYKKYVDPDFVYENFTLQEQGRILKAGRSNNYLATEKLQGYCAHCNLDLPTIEQALEVTLQEYKYF